MDRWVVSAVAALLFFLSASPACAERELIVPFHESGHVVLDQLAGLRLSTSGFSYSAPIGIAVRKVDGQSETNLWFAPSADVFVTDHLSLGGLVEVNHSWGTVAPSATTMTFLPRVGFYAPISDRFGIWGRAGVGWTRTEEVTTLTRGEALVLDVDATVVYRFTETFFMKAGPEVGATFGSRDVLQLGGALGFGMNIEL